MQGEVGDQLYPLSFAGAEPCRSWRESQRVQAPGGGRLRLPSAFLLLVLGFLLSSCSCPQSPSSVGLGAGDRALFPSRFLTRIKLPLTANQVNQAMGFPEGPASIRPENTAHFLLLHLFLNSKNKKITLWGV